MEDSLRLSRKAYWRRSLERFRDLLAPGGLLIASSMNALAVYAEVGSLAEEAGFFVARNGRQFDRTFPPARQPDRKTYVGVWPTG